MAADDALDQLCAELERPPIAAYEADAARASESVPRHRPEAVSAPAGAEAFQIQRLDQAQLGTRRSIVQGLGFDEGAVVAIGGSPNAGKTALAVNMGVTAAARQQMWLGRKILGTPVLYFAAEAPASVKMRAKAAASDIGASASLPFYVCDVAPAIGGEAMSVVDAQRVVATAKSVEQVQGEPALLLFLDTLASCLGDGDENGDGMIRLVNAAKYVATQTGACVVLVHHPSKGDGASLRGHGSLSAACDSVLRIETDEMTKVRTATVMKARDHATGAQIRFELEPVTLPERDSFGDPCTTVVVRASDQVAQAPRPRGAARQKLLDELERRYHEGERHWDEASIGKIILTLRIHRNSRRTVLKELIKAGYVTGGSDHHTLKYPPEGQP